jgi:hypothetical protein
MSICLAPGHSVSGGLTACRMLHMLHCNALYSCVLHMLHIWGLLMSWYVIRRKQAQMLCSSAGMRVGYGTALACVWLCTLGDKLVGLP